MFDVVCLATGDTKHLYPAYLGYILFKLLHHARGWTEYIPRILLERCYHTIKIDIFAYNFFLKQKGEIKVMFCLKAALHMKGID